MTPIAEIIRPGLSTSIQDGGRPGARHLGIPLSGAADPLSLALANAAVGNAPGQAALECTISGPSLRFIESAEFALAGADMSAKLNGAPIPLYASVRAEPGGELALGAATAGARAYLAFAGGLSGKMFLNSVSTYPPARLGGLDGRALKRGDILVSAQHPVLAPREIPTAMQPRFTGTHVLRAMTGPEAKLLHENEIEKFFSARWTAARRADRMGVQLEGQTLTLPELAPMNSSPVFPGTVQCPPAGAPFLLLCDAQTIGGYPRIAQIIAADLPLAGQLRPGDQLWFRKTTADMAQEIGQRKSALYGGLFPGGFFR